MEREGKSSKKDQASVNLRRTGMEKQTRKDKDKFTGKERIMDYEKS